MTALILSGSNNIYLAKTDEGEILECRLKGKVLKGAEGFYNPIAPGDRVVLSVGDTNEGEALITGLSERRNVYARWNQKGNAPQLLASNLDLILCVVTPASPPFRPRFLDRALLQGDIAGIPPVIVLNKCDLDFTADTDGFDADAAERLEDFRRIGYRILRVSALSGLGLEELRELIGGRTGAMVGQSGVGKSSLLNALSPGLALRTGELCAKFDRGSHTTTMARLIAIDAPRGGGFIVDTPGVRRLVPDGTNAAELASHFREFAPIVGTCTFGASCSHETEPGCRIMEAVAAGLIHEDRYESYLRIKEELAERLPAYRKS